LQCQFPTAFEFNEKYLIAIVDGALSNWATTFSLNSEKERSANPSKHTLWQLLEGNRYLNPLYEPTEKKSSFIQPKCTMQAMQFWSGLYLRFNAFSFSVQ
jgi:hypothetical protein